MIIVGDDVIMRKDEDEMKSIIEEKVLAQNYPNSTISDGKDPPDYVIKHDNKSIALEVTNIDDMVEHNGDFKNSNEFIKPVLDIINKLSIKFSSQLNPYEKLVYKVTIPLLSPNAFKTKIEDMTSHLLSLEYKEKLEGSLVIGKDCINWKRISTQVNTPRISPMVFHNNNHSISIDYNISRMLICAICKKNMKMSAVTTQLFSEKWLCLKSNYTLDSDESFSYVINNLDIEHDFAKIIIIDSSNNAIQYDFTK